MSDYRYETHNGGIDIRESVNQANVFVWVHEDRKEAAIIFPKADVPTVAAELLRAAGQESVIVPRSTRPVEVRQFDQLRCGDAATHADEDPVKLRGFASDFIAMAEWIEAKAAREAAEKAEAEAAEKKLRSRRGALARELLRLDVTYDELGRDAPMRAAIDRIIELEDGASRD